jgi:hypothetical protein
MLVARALDPLSISFLFAGSRAVTVIVTTRFKFGTTEKAFAGASAQRPKISCSFSVISAAALIVAEGENPQFADQDIHWPPTLEALGGLPFDILQTLRFGAAFADHSCGRAIESLSRPDRFMTEPTNHLLRIVNDTMEIINSRNGDKERTPLRVTQAAGF